MSSIPVPPSMGSSKVDTYQRTDIGGTDTVDMQVVVPGNPFLPTTGSLTAVGSVTAANLNDACSALVVLQGTFSATVIFEGSGDGTNWFALQAARADTNSAITTAGLALAFTAQTIGYKLDLNGAVSFRVRISAYTSGTMNVLIAPSPHSMQPTPYVALASVIGINASTSTTGMSTSKLIAAAGVNATLIKGSAGKVYSYAYENDSATKVYLKFYNKATAPTVGTDVPFITIPVKPAEKIVFNNDIGITFSLGIGLAVTGAAADSDTTAVSASGLIGALHFV